VTGGGFLSPALTLHFKVDYGIVDADGTLLKDTVPPAGSGGCGRASPGRSPSSAGRRSPIRSACAGYRVTVAGRPAGQPQPARPSPSYAHACVGRRSRSPLSIVRATSARRRSRACASCARLRGIDPPPPQDAGNPLALDREQMRALGYSTVDALVDGLTDEGEPPLRSATPAEMQARLGALEPCGAPVRGRAAGILFRGTSCRSPARSAHPRFFAYVPFAVTWPGALGDFVASACNVYAGSWQESAGADAARAPDSGLVQGVGRLPGKRGRLARQRRLGPRT